MHFLLLLICPSSTRVTPTTLIQSAPPAWAGFLLPAPAAFLLHCNALYEGASLPRMSCSSHLPCGPSTSNRWSEIKVKGRKLPISQPAVGPSGSPEGWAASPASQETYPISAWRTEEGLFHVVCPPSLLPPPHSLPFLFQIRTQLQKLLIISK